MDLCPTPVCLTCGAKMALNAHADVGDPGFVCSTDDPAHRAAAAARKAERERLLADAAKPKPGPAPDELAAIGAWERADATAARIAAGKDGQK